MSVIEFLTSRINSCFLNCFLPPNDLLLSTINIYLFCDSEVIEKNNEHIVVSLKYDNNHVRYNFILANGLTEKSRNQLVIRKIELLT